MNLRVKNCAKWCFIMALPLLHVILPYVHALTSLLYGTRNHHYWIMIKTFMLTFTKYLIMYYLCFSFHIWFPFYFYCNIFAQYTNIWMMKIDPLCPWQARRMLVKLDIYRKFTNALAVAVIVSVGWICYEVINCLLMNWQKVIEIWLWNTLLDSSFICKCTHWTMH